MANDLSAYATDKYKIDVVPRFPGSALRFHLGAQIEVKWRVPRHHSRKDWIGLYRVGANQSPLVTRTSSLGMWVPVHSEEWDGDVPIDKDSQASTPADREGSGAHDEECGTVVFKGDSLPWTVGNYEVRYHHDGKYNVLALERPIEIYGASSIFLPCFRVPYCVPVDRPEKVDFDSVRAALAHIVPLCLDGDPSLIPSSTKHGSGTVEDSEGNGGDPDDFRFWSARQAGRIARAVREMFGVEYAPDVVVADANLTTLAERIVASRKLMHGDD